MPKLRHDPMPSLASLLEMSLEDLTELDDGVLRGILEQLLPSGDRLVDRVWQNYAEARPRGA